MQKSKFNELISCFNRKVSEMDIGTSYKMELLGMVTALGYAHEKETEERKTGRWIRTRMPLTGAIEHRCSRCDTPYYMAFAMEMNYCPACGARMEGGE